METSPKARSENTEVKVLWDFEIRPNILVIDKANCTTTIIDVVIHVNYKIKDK